jgi:hypothetical protein
MMGYQLRTPMPNESGLEKIERFVADAEERKYMIAAVGAVVLAFTVTTVLRTAQLAQRACAERFEPDPGPLISMHDCE